MHKLRVYNMAYFQDITAITHVNTQHMCRKMVPHPSMGVHKLGGGKLLVGPREVMGSCSWSTHSIYRWLYGWMVELLTLVLPLYNQYNEIITIRANKAFGNWNMNMWEDDNVNTWVLNWSFSYFLVNLYRPSWWHDDFYVLCGKWHQVEVTC